MSNWVEDEFSAIEKRFDGIVELCEAKRQAFQAFCKKGFPRSSEEAWKYTSLNSLKKAQLVIRSHAETLSNNESSESANPMDFPCSAENSANFIFQDGEFVKFTGRALPAEIVTLPLSSVLRGEAGTEEKARALSSLQRENKDGTLVDLNTALFSDGLYVRIPDGIKCEVPIFLSHRASKRGTSFQVKAIFSLGNSASGLIREEFLGLQGGEYYVNFAEHCVIEENAELAMIRLQSESCRATHTSSSFVTQKRDSSASILIVNFGGNLVRNEFYHNMLGENAELVLNGINMLSGNQHVDNYSEIKHSEASCKSKEIFKGVYADSSRGIFSGTIKVCKKGQKTNAIQSNNSILLSPNARADSRPCLKIFADDVRCTHGSTVGALEEKALFYIKSRGVNESRAKMMLIEGFLSEVIEEFVEEQDSLWSLVRNFLDRINNVE